MRSSRALYGLCNGPRRPFNAAVCPIAPTVISRYCASCEAPPAPKEVKATNNPSTPPADHRKLAVEQELFTSSIHSPGSPLFLPNGTRIFNRLTNFLRAQYSHYGFQEVISPTIYKKSLWQTSGHWENYADDMYSVQGRGASGDTEGKQAGEDEEYGLKPMNCPGHCLMFASKQRSYRDMPIRFADFSPLHRNEISGALSGLTRVRRFHQDDGHIFCRPSQVAEEISKTLHFIKIAYQTFNLGEYRLALSTRPKDHFIGTLEEWDRAENALQSALNASGQEWNINEGDGAFYGPKIDIILKDSDGKEHQTATIQLDFQLPKRFDLQYQAPAPDLEEKGVITTDPELLSTSGPVRPVMIHRAILGSVERFMALLIEHYNGRWPVWLNPNQVILITVSDNKEIVDFANQAAEAIRHEEQPENPYWPEIGKPISTKCVEVLVDDTPRSVKKKISEAKRKRYSFIAVVGKNNVEGSKKLTVDMTALSDPGGILRRFYWLDKWVTTNLPQSEVPEGYVTIGGVPDGHPLWNEIPPDELSKMEVSPKQLRDLVLRFEERYQ